jgi:hypothetical protein
VTFPANPAATAGLRSLTHLYGEPAQRFTVADVDEIIRAVDRLLAN